MLYVLRWKRSFFPCRWWTWRIWHFQFHILIISNLNLIRKLIKTVHIRLALVLRVYYCQNFSRLCLYLHHLHWCFSSSILWPLGTNRDFHWTCTGQMSSIECLTDTEDIHFPSGCGWLFTYHFENVKSFCPPPPDCIFCILRTSEELSKLGACHEWKYSDLWRIYEKWNFNSKVVYACSKEMININCLKLDAFVLILIVNSNKSKGLCVCHIHYSVLCFAFFLSSIWERHCLVLVVGSSQKGIQDRRSVGGSRGIFKFFMDHTLQNFAHSRKRPFESIP